MQVGFAMLLAGSIREKNVANVLLWNLLDSAGGALAFWSIGFALAYGGDTPGGPKTFVGNTGFFLATEGIDLHFWYVWRGHLLVAALLMVRVVLTPPLPSTSCYA